MSKEQDHIRDLAEIRSMMERSSKFLSLSGWSGALAGIYALIGACIAYYVLNFNPDQLIYDTQSNYSSYQLLNVLFLAVGVLIMAIGTAIFYSYKKAEKRNEKFWNASSKNVLESMAIPLAAGGILIAILISKELIGLIAPMMLLFYGLALFSSSKFIYIELKYLGLIQIILSLLGCVFIEYGVLLWAIGFGVFHIIYGIYIHYRYEQ